MDQEHVSEGDDSLIFRVHVLAINSTLTSNASQARSSSLNKVNSLVSIGTIAVQFGKRLPHAV